MHVRDLAETSRGLELTRLERAAVDAIAAEVARHHEGVDLSRGQHRVGDIGEARDVLLATAGDVDGVDGRGRGREVRRHRISQAGGEVRHREASVLGDVRGDRRVSAAVGEHRDPVAVRAGHRAERREHVGHLLRRVHSDDARLVAGGIHDRGRRHHRAGVRLRLSSGGLAAPDRQQHDGLTGVGRLTRGGDETSAVAEVLGVHRDSVRARMIDAPEHEIGRIEIGLVAQGRKAREAELVLDEQLSELERQVAALRQEGNAPAGQRIARELKA